MARVLFPVRVTKDGGEDGDNALATPATWTYTLRSMDGKRVIGQGMSPETGRPPGTMIPAEGIGMAAISHGQVVLVQVPEQWTGPLLDEKGEMVVDEEGQVVLKGQR